MPELADHKQKISKHLRTSKTHFAFDERYKANATKIM
jgi:hypothetical protein